MFLDDELKQMCKEADLTAENGVQETYQKVMYRCEKYLKDKIGSGTSDKELKTIMDKTFNLFNSFVRGLQKEKNAVLISLGFLFERNDFKTAFLKDERVANVYRKLGGKV